MGAVFFSRITFAGLMLNFLAIPLMGVAQVAGMCVVPLALVSAPMAGFAGFVAHLGAAGLVWSADLVRYVPQSTFRVAQPAWAAVCAYYLALGWWWAGERRAWVPCAAIVLAATWIVAEPWAWLAARGDGRLHVTFLDVGQGDSLLVRFPRGTTMLVDAGGLGRSSSFDIGDRVVAPVLRAAGIRRLDYVVLSHGDPDHIGGLPAIIREFRPREVWEGIAVPSFEPLTALRVQTQALGARWANVYAGDRIRVDDVDVLARHPMPADWERRRVRNDDSLVLDLRWRNVSVLLTGDVGKGVERSLEEGVPPPALRILKVPHHGSLTSSSVDFVRRLAPQVAVVSVGRGNHFGHPAPDVLDRYHDVGAAIFRTDRDGAVTLETDGRSIELQSFAGRHAVLSGDRVYREDATVSGLR
jgi:competence protein ComEC